MPGLSHNANVYDTEEPGFIFIAEIEVILSYKAVCPGSTHRVINNI
jgi:hypothetical protein